MGPALGAASVWGDGFSWWFRFGAMLLGPALFALRDPCFSATRVWAVEAFIIVFYLSLETLKIKQDFL